MPEVSISSAPTRDVEIPDAPAMASEADDQALGRSLESGTQLGRYVVLYRLGGGGMGIVYAAYDPQLDRKVALKVMKPRRRATSRERARKRLLEEAQALARLAHPNVVAIHDVGVIDEVVYVAMDFVEGRTIREWLRQQRRSVDEIVDVFVQAGRGLAAAHEAGIVHRDFKPDNVLVEKGRPGKEASKGRVQVVDFGLALVRDSDTDPSVDSASGSDPGTGVPGRVGTPGYMAPEQHLGLDVSAHADQFAFCVCLYEALWSRGPFAGADTQERALNVLQGNIREVPRNVRVPGHLRRLVMRGLSREPSDRFGSMKALLVELQKRPWRRWRRMASTSAFVLAATGATWLWANDGTTDIARCDAPRERLAPAWSDDVRARVHAGLAQTRRPHAPHTATRVVDTLHRYAEDWGRAYTEACEATHVHHEQSEVALELTMSCLTRVKGELSALTHLLSQADDEIADNALAAAQALPAIAPCRDVARLRDRSALPADQAQREQIERQYERLAHARALEHAGRVSDAVSVSEAVVEQANELGHTPLLAEALLEHAVALEAAARSKEAADVLRRAVVQAETARDDRLLARVRLALTSVVGDRLTKLDEGKLWASLTRATIDRLGGDLAMEAQLENVLAFVIGSEAAPEEVLAHHRRAVELAEQAGLADTIKATYYNNLAASLAEVGSFDEALKNAELAKKLAEASFGPGHYRTAIMDATFGLIYESQDNHELALQRYEAAVRSLDRALGPGNLRTASVLNNIGVTAARTGDLQRAARAFERVLELQLAAHGELHADVAQAHHNLAGLAALAGEHDRALTRNEKALAIRQQLFGSDSLQVAGSLDGMANALEQLGRNEESLHYRNKALAIEERVYGPRHFEMSIPYANQAHTLLLVGRHQQALEKAERALQLALDHDLRRDVKAFARLVLAKVLSHRSRDHERVRALAQQAEQELQGLPAPAERRILEELKRRHRWDRAPGAGERGPAAGSGAPPAHEPP